MAALLCDHIFMWLCYEQGEAPGLFEDHIDGFRLSYEGSETSIDICSNKKVWLSDTWNSHSAKMSEIFVYEFRKLIQCVIGGMENESNSTIGVRIFDKSTGEWCVFWFKIR